MTPGQTYAQPNYSATELDDPRTNRWDNYLYRGVWYTFTTTNRTRVNLRTCGSSFDTQISVYTGSCPALVPFWGNDYGGSGGLACSDPHDASMTFTSPGNQTFYVLAGSYGPDAWGTLNISVEFQDPPANDNCAGAVAMTPGQTYTQPNYSATELDDPRTNRWDNYLYRGVWYTFTTTNRTRVNLRTCGSSFDTQISVYTGSCPALVPFWGNDYGGSGGLACSDPHDASMTFTSPGNQTFYVLAGSYGPDAWGTLNISVEFQDPPANDNCAGAVAMTPGQTYAQPNYSATELDDPRTNRWDNYLYRGVWYTFTTTNRTRVNLRTCGSSFDTQISVYTGSCPALVPFWGNDYGGSGGLACSDPHDASMTFTSPGNQTFYVLAGSYGPDAWGTLNISVEFQDPPANDNCAGAVAMTPGQTYTQPNYSATELDDPRTNRWDNYLYRGVWYTFTTTNRTRVNLRTCGSSFDTQISVYTGSCPALVPFWGNDYGGSGGLACSDPHDASMTFTSPGNQTFYVLAGSYGPDAWGTLNISVEFQDPPANDNCAGAVAMTPGQTYAQPNYSATEIGDPTASWASGLYRGVWYTITPPAGAWVTIQTCASDFDTRLAVYTGDCEGPVQMTGNDNNGPACSGSSRASVNFSDIGGRTYFILAGSSGPDASGTLRIVATVEPPENDRCPGAISMTPGLIYLVNTLNATETDDLPPTCSSGFRGGVWYTYQPTVSGPVAVNTCASDFDTALAVYTGSCAALVQIACNDDNGPVCPGNRASLNFNAVAGTTYRILAGGRNGAAGDLRISIGVVDLVATNLTATDLIIGGRNFSANWTVLNQGTNSINADWLDQLSLSNAFTNIVIAQFSGRHNAPAGGSYVNSFNRVLPPLPDGTYSLIAALDVNGQVAETSEGNNTRVVSVTISNILPSITLLAPTNTTQQTSCVPVSVRLSARATAGSYAISRVEFFTNGVLMAADATSPYRLRSPLIPHGIHTIAAQAVDILGLRSPASSIAMVEVHWPGLHQLVASLNANGEVVCCMGAEPGSNYVSQATTNLSNPVLWKPYLTNRVEDSGLLIFTNHLPLLHERYFRVLHQP